MEKPINLKDVKQGMEIREEGPGYSVKLRALQDAVPCDDESMWWCRFEWLGGDIPLFGEDKAVYLEEANEPGIYKLNLTLIEETK